MCSQAPIAVKKSLEEFVMELTLLENESSLHDQPLTLLRSPASIRAIDCVFLTVSEASRKQGQNESLKSEYCMLNALTQCAG